MKQPENLPTRLLIPGEFDETVGIPPAEPLKQLLPLGQLSFENFQRICVRLLAASKAAIHCQEYGVRGQPQEGIDLYARVPGQAKLEVWQCKRYQTFKASEIGAATSAFLDGELVGETGKFVLVTTADTENTTLARAEQKAAKDLSLRNIDFALLGRSQLSTMLKSHPEIIDDFFRRDWVKAICGEDAAALLVDRLSGIDVSQFRLSLRSLYEAVFERNDSFVSSAFENATSPSITFNLAKRWVMPSINYRIDAPALLRQDDREPETSSREQQGSIVDNKTKSHPNPHQDTSIFEEMDADTFLGSFDKSVILGDPGFGKSAMLRMVALDLLSQSPTLKTVATRFGNCLPVWLPFAFFSKKLGEGLSPIEVASAWLHTHGGTPDHDRLLRLAMRDKRLLLLVDGLDEWSNEEIARAGLASIQGFLSQGNAACIVTARPLGYQKLDRLPGDWKHGTLMPLSEEQQETLATRLMVPHNSHGISVTNSHLELNVERFTRSLRRDDSLRQMAGTPLLLIGLVSLWKRNQALPHSRFTACDELVREMLDNHPSRRAAASSPASIEISLSPEIRRAAIASLARTLHGSEDTTSISRSAAEASFVEYFRDIEGMTLSDARGQARQMLPISAQVIGILSEASPTGDIQFVHRTFQEFLAAEDLHSLPIEEQVAFCHKHAGDPTWQQILLFLLQRCNRPNDTFTLIQAIEKLDISMIASHSRKLLIAEAIFSHIRLAPAIRAERATAILDEIETSTWMPLREELLSKCLSAPQASNVYGLLIERLKLWTPMPQALQWGSGLCEALELWPDNSGAEEALWRLVNHEKIATQLRAAQTLGRRCKGDENWKARFKDRLNEPLDSESLGACLVGLATGWAYDPDVVNIFDQGIKSQSPHIVVGSAFGLVSAGRQNAEIKRRLISNSDRIWFSEIVVQTVLKGWPGDTEIRDLALDRITNRYHSGEFFGYDVAWRIVTEGYPGDDEVAKRLAEHLLKDDRLFSHNVNRSTLLNGFSGHPEIVGAAEQWLKQMDRLDTFEASPIAALARTSKTKQLLIEWTLTQKNIGFHAADCLVEAWGADDPDVASALERASKNEDLVDNLALVLARTAKDKQKMRSTLLGALKSKRANLRNDFLLRGLKLLRTDDPDNEVVSVALSRILPAAGDSLSDTWAATCLIDGFWDHPQVRELALSRIKYHDCEWGLMASVYRHDPEVRSLVLKCCRCLPERLRLAIAAHCRQRAAYDSQVREVAMGFTRECARDVRVLGAIAAAEASMSLGEDHSDQANYFGEEVLALGPDYEIRHETGIAGLIALRELSRIKDCKRLGKGTVAIHFNYSYSGDPVLPVYMVRRWEHVTGALGDKLWDSFFTDHDIDTLRKAASSVGRRDLASEIASVLQSRSNKGHPPLEVLASKQSPDWVEACLSVLGLSEKSPPKTSINVAEAAEASHILARHAAGDKEIQSRLESMVGAGCAWASHAILTLARGWPNSPVLQSMWENSNSNRLIDDRISNSLVCCFANSGDFVTWLRNWLSGSIHGERRWNFSEDRWFIMRRCFNDEAVAMELIEALASSPTEDECASFPWLVRSSTLENAETELQMWAEQRIRTERWTAFGFDMFKGQMVPLKTSLLEIIMTDRRYVLI